MALALAPLDHDETRATEALMLVVPVIATAVVGGRRAAYAVSAAAAIAFSLLIPPVGSVRVRLTEDLVALLVFVAVSVVVGTMVARRIELLGRIEQQQRTLLRSVSHDLRTPLSTIAAAATELLDEDHYDRQARRKLLHLIADETGRLDRLVGNLLSLSRIESGAFEPSRQPVDLSELADGCAQRLVRLFDDKTLTVDVADGLPMIDVDYSQIDQVMTNLIENAARHSPPAGTVRLRAGALDGNVLISVSDSGPGVDPSRRRIIFEPFRSGTIAGASGIGLATCRAIVEAHGGTITVDASDDGGACFVVSLPVR